MRGNIIIGSNIFDILLVLSLGPFVNPVKYNVAFNTDIYILTCETIFLFVAMFTGEKKKLDRWETVILLAFFLTYTIYLIGKEI